MAAPVQPSALGLAGGPQLEKQPVQDGETESTEPTGSDVSMSRKTEESPRQIHGLKVRDLDSSLDDWSMEG